MPSNNGSVEHGARENKLGQEEEEEDEEQAQKSFHRTVLEIVQKFCSGFITLGLAWYASDQVPYWTWQLK